nr:hypothetical protein [Streptomyces sp. IBTA2]
MVDKLVVSRESWRFTGGELGFAEEKSEARRYVRARNWRSERGFAAVCVRGFTDGAASVLRGFRCSGVREHPGQGPLAGWRGRIRSEAHDHGDAAQPRARVADRRPGQHLHLRTPLRRRRPEHQQGGVPSW